MIRPAEEKDLTRIMEIDKASFDVPWTRRALLDMMENSASARIRVFEERGVEGFIIYSLIDGEAEIFALAAAEESRNRGVGTALIGEMLENADSAFLEVRKSNAPALRLYKKCGFEMLGERKKFYSDGEDAYTMIWKR